MDKSILIFGLANPDYLPLVRALAQEGFTLIMNASPLVREAEMAGLEFHLFEGFFSPEIRACAQREVTRISNNLLKNLEAGSAIQAFASPLGNFIPYTGQEFFQQLGPLLATEITAMEALDLIAGLWDLRLILLDCDNDCSQRTLVNYARRLGIPSLHLAHGIYSKPQVHVAGEVDRLNADHIALFGNRARDNFVGSGNPAEKIFLTGAPLWDPLYKPEVLLDVRAARRQLGLDPNRPVVLFCSSYAEGSSAYFRFRAQRMQAIHEAVVQALAQIGPQVQFIVRPHPNELRRATISPEDSSWILEAYRRWLARYGVSSVYLSVGNKIEAIRAADVVIVADQSSMVPEAMILQKPVIMPTLLQNFQTTYTEADGIIVIEEKGRLVEALENLITNPSEREAMVQRQNAALPELNFGNDGRATERVATLVLDLAHRKSTSPATTAPRTPATAGPGEAGLNLVFAAHNFLPYFQGGTEIYTHDLARAMQRRGHQVRVMYPVPDDSLADNFSLAEGFYGELPVVEILSPPPATSFLSNEALRPLLRRYFRDNPVDLVHVQHLRGLSISFLEILQELAIPVVLTANDFWFLCSQTHLVTPGGTVCEGPETIDQCVHCLSRRQGLTEEHLPQAFHFLAQRYYAHRKALRLPDLILCPSRFLLGVFQRYGFVNDRMVHLSQGANLFTPAPRPHRAIPPVIFSYLGGIFYRKGLDLLLDAFNQLDTTGVELHLYGDIVEQDYFATAMQSVLPGKRVTYHGGYQPPDLPGILADTDVAVVPSRGENYPFVIREILHAQVPVIAAAVAGIPEIVIDNQNGLLFRENDAQDLAVKLARLIEEPELIATLRAGIQPMKSLEQDAADIEAYYRDILSQRASTTGAITSRGPAPHAGERPGRTAVETSIVIPVWNNLELTRQCLESLWPHTPADAYEVIVVDNGSTDGTTEFLQQEKAAGRVRVVFNKHNLGFAKACNQGAQAARGDYLVFLNNDTLVTPGWLEGLLNCAKRDESIAIVGAKLLYPDDSVQHAGAVFNEYRKVYHIHRYLNKNHPAVNKEREFQVVTAACMLIKKDSFFKANLFDERYQNGFEDVDLCFKIRQMGQKIVYTPHSVVYHLESKTPGRFIKDEDNSKLFNDLWLDQIIPDDSKYYQEDGILMEWLGNETEQRWLILHDANENSFWQKAVKYKEQELFQEAIKHYKKAIKFNPFDPRHLTITEELAELHESLGNYLEAANCYEYLKKIEPSPHHYFKLGLLHKKMNNFTEAIEYLEKAKELLTGSVSNNELAPDVTNWAPEAMII